MTPKVFIILVELFVKLVVLSKVGVSIDSLSDERQVRVKLMR